MEEHYRLIRDAIEYIEYILSTHSKRITVSSLSRSHSALQNSHMSVHNRYLPCDTPCSVARRDTQSVRKKSPIHDHEKTKPNKTHKAPPSAAYKRDLSMETEKGSGVDLLQLSPF
jgi:hypothetical protein